MNYKKLKDLKYISKENYFVSYAVRGPTICPSKGLEVDMPVREPISGPIKEPSSLNSQYLLKD